MNDASLLPRARAEEMSRLGGEELMGELCHWLGRHLQNAPWLADLKAKTVRELDDIAGYIGLPFMVANSKAPLIDKIMRRVSMNGAAKLVCVCPCWSAVALAQACCVRARVAPRSAPGHCSAGRRSDAHGHLGLVW